MSFRFRLIVAVSLVIALTFGIGGTLLIQTSFSTSLAEETAAALESFESVQSLLYLTNQYGENNNNYKGLSNALAQIKSRDMANWQAISLKTETETLYTDDAQMMRTYDLPEPKQGKCAYMNVADEYGYGVIILKSISDSDEPLLLKARFEVSNVYTARDTQMRLFFIIYIGVVLLGILTATLLSFAMTGRLKKLTVAVRQVAGGDLSTRSNLKSKDEFGQLSRDFDAMTDKLAENIQRLESEMQRQEAFMGAFAHELKTPMTSIIGYADLLRQDGLPDDTRLRSADYIYSEGQRLEKLSFKLLDLLLLGKDETAMKRVSLYAFTVEIAKALDPTMRAKGIRFTCKAVREKAVFEPDLVKSLVYNLIDNASKAIEQDGEITLTAVAIAGGCQFIVQDNGRGMERDQLAKITEAFYRVDKARSRAQGGAGLGLALCKEIVALHHGDMRFESEPGQGTTVTVTLYGLGGENDAEV